MSRGMAFTLDQAVLAMVTTSDDEYVRLSMQASHCCPNCDGPILTSEDEAAGICSDCYFADISDSWH